MVMRITELGEFGLIERIKRSIRLDATVVKGIGDDCAAIRYGKDRYMLLTCDMIIEGVDFTRKDTPFLIGRKALAVSISDIAACAGIPRYALISLALPRRTSVKYIDELLRGMRLLAKQYGISIVGGDLSRAEKVTIDVSMVGVVEKKNFVPRSGACIGDMIFVTGDLGGSIRGKHLTFTPRVKEARFLVKHAKINSMIDISDGLLQDLNHILTQSNVGAMIYEGLLPVNPQAKYPNEALCMGEDFELLFTVSLKEARKLMRYKKRFTLIGHTVAKKQGFTLVDRRGRQTQIKPKGFSHF
jgi:thiamine-monophosphate kinase